MRSTWSLKIPSRPMSSSETIILGCWASHPRQYRPNRWYSAAEPAVHSEWCRLTASIAVLPQPCGVLLRTHDPSLRPWSSGPAGRCRSAPASPPGPPARDGTATAAAAHRPATPPRSPRRTPPASLTSSDRSRPAPQASYSSSSVGMCSGSAGALHLGDPSPSEHPADQPVVVEHRCAVGSSATRRSPVRSPPAGPPGGTPRGCSRARAHGRHGGRRGSREREGRVGGGHRGRHVASARPVGRTTHFVAKGQLHGVAAEGVRVRRTRRYPWR